MLKQMEELKTHAHTHRGTHHTHAKANISVHSHTKDVPILCMFTYFQTLQKHTSKRLEDSRQLLKRKEKNRERRREKRHFSTSNQRGGGEQTVEVERERHAKRRVCF